VLLERTLRLALEQTFVLQNSNTKHICFQIRHTVANTRYIHKDWGKTDVENPTTKYKAIQDLVVILYIPVSGLRMC